MSALPLLTVTTATLAEIARAFDPPLLLWPLVFGLAFHAAITAPWLPLGRPRPDLLEQLRRLDVEELSPTRVGLAGQEPQPLLPFPAIDALLRPVVDDLAGAARSALARFGLAGGREVEERLLLLRPNVPIALLVEQFWGRKLLCGLVPLGLFLLVRAFGTRPLADWPFVVWPLLAVGGFLFPDYKLNWQVARRRERIVAELPAAIDLLTIGLAGGQSLEQTLLLMTGEGRGVIAGELADALREVAATRRALPAALDELGRRNGVPELAALITPLRAALEHGTADLVPLLSVQAAALREQKRLRILAEAKRAQVRMLLPVAVGILPVLIIVLLAPAAMRLLGLGG